MTFRLGGTAVVILAVAGVLGVGCGDRSSSAATTTASAAAACARTVSLTEGPYFKAGSPARRTLRTSGVKGTPLRLTGRVVDRSCQPIAGALLDFWQADGTGAYDNNGFRLRGHQRTRADGSWTLNTVVPGLYPGRTEHIHVKVRRRTGSTLTTQLFFPGAASNGSDGIYVASMLVRNFRRAGAGYRATFTFVVS